MPSKQFSSERMITKLCEAEVLLSQDLTMICPLNHRSAQHRDFFL